MKEHALDDRIEALSRSTLARVQQLVHLCVPRFGPVSGFRPGSGSDAGSDLTTPDADADLDDGGNHQAVELRASPMPGAGLGLFLRHGSPAGRAVLREHVLVAEHIQVPGVSTAWGLALSLLLQGAGRLPDWVARLHHNEPFAARQLEDPGDRRLLAWLVRESRRDEAAVRLAFGIAVTNHFASADVAWLGQLSSRFNHGPLRVGNTTPGPRLVPGTPELAGRLGVRLGVPGPRFGVLEWVLVRDTAAGQELTLPYPDGYRDF